MDYSIQRFVNFGPALTGSMLLSALGCTTTDFLPTPAPHYSHSFELISQTATLGSTKDVWVEGDTAFVADNERGVSIWDVSRVNRPAWRDTLLTSGPAQAVCYSAGTGLLLTLETRYETDINGYNLGAKRREFSFGGKVETDLGFRDVSPDTIIVAGIDSDNNGYELEKCIRRFDPTQNDAGWHEIYRRFHPPRGIYYALLMDSDFTYIANGECGVTVLCVDYSTLDDNTNLVTYLGGVDTPGSVRDLAINRSRTHLFAADFQSGLQIVDVSDKAHPRVMGSLLPEGVHEAFKVSAVGDTAVFLDRNNGIFAADVSDPHNPVLIGVYHTPSPSGLFIRASDKKVFVTDESLGLLILSLH